MFEVYKSIPIILLLSACVNLQLAGQHLIGGEISWTCQGNHMFEIEVKVYWDCYELDFGDALPATTEMRFFLDDNSTAWQVGQAGVVELTLKEEGEIDPGGGQLDPCFFVPVTVCINYGIYRGTVFLPFSSGGYQMAAYFGNRKTEIDNIRRTVPSGPILRAHMHEHKLWECESSDRFNDLEQFYFCIDEPLELDHSIAVTDADSVVYELFTPYLNTWDVPPFNPVRYEDGFSLNNKLGSGEPLTIDRKTGMLTAVPEQYGVFLVGVSATTYRDGEPTSELYRDFFIYVGDCDGANADFNIPDFYCRFLRIEFSDINESFLSSLWIVGDPSDPLITSTLDRPEINFPAYGEYEVTRIAFGPEEGCHDTLTQTIEIRPDEVQLYYEIEWENCTGDSIHFSVIAKSDLIDLSELDFGMSVWWGSNSASSQDTIVEVAMESRYSVMIRPEINDGDICVYTGAEHLVTGVVFNAGLEESYLLCGGSMVLDDHFDSRNDGHDFKWTPEAGILSATDAQIVEVAPDTTTTYTGSATRNECEGEFIYHIEVVNPDTPFLPDTICGRTHQVKFNPLHEFSIGSTWRIFQGGILIGSRIGDFPILDFPGYGLTTVELVPLSLDGMNCPDSLTQEIYILDPSVDWEIEVELLNCTDSLEILLTGLPEGNLFGEPLYKITTEYGDTLQRNSPDFQLTIPGTDELEFSLEIQTDRGCSTLDHFSLSIPYYPELNNSEPLKICRGDSTELNIDIPDGLNYEWTSGTGFVTDSSALPVYVSPDSTELFELSIQDVGCIYRYQFEVEVEFPKIIELEEINICEDNLNQHVDFSNIGPEGYENWIVFDPEGNVIESGTETNTEIQFPEFGEYSIEFFVDEGDYECGVEASTTYRISAPDKWQAEIFPLEVHCRGNDVDLLLEVDFSEDISEFQPFNVEWYIAATDTIKFTSDSLNVTVKGIDEFGVLLRFSDKFGCSGTDQISYSFEQFTVPDKADSLEVCPGGSVELWPEAPGTLNYIWSPATGISGSLTEPNPMASPVISTFYEVQISSENCVDTHGVQVDLLPAPVVTEVNSDPTSIQPGESALLSVSFDGPVDEIFWSPPENLDDPFATNPIAEPETSTEYSVIITSSAGCKDSGSVFVRVEDYSCNRPFIFLPNAFSPNGDGVNDVLYVRGEEISEVNLRIYDRFGRQVFNGDHRDIGWDGSLNGEEAPAGVYSYSLKVVCKNGETFNESGNVSLIR